MSTPEMTDKVEVTIELKLPLGADFLADGTVNRLEPGSQLTLTGEVSTGDRVIAAGGTSLETFDELNSLLKQNKKMGQKLVTMTFKKVGLSLACVPRLSLQCSASPSKDNASHSGIVCLGFPGSITVVGRRRAIDETWHK